MLSVNTIRTSIRQQRNALSKSANRLHGEAVAARLGRLSAFRKASRIGIYLPVNGELDTWPLIDFSRSLGKQLYLPVLHPFRHGHLFFCEWKPDTSLVINRFGIEEPVCTSSSLASLRYLDIVIVPLVAFDASKQRIGMGGGFYDRTFGYGRSFKQWKRPLLAGVAHSFQQVDAIDASAWDVPLDLVITETALF